MASQQETSFLKSSYSNSTQRTWKYHIFLSFKGEDTRKGFTDHLYHALGRSGFKVFRDDEELEKGEVISKELLQAIEESNFAIVVLSKNYASSSWCLNELQHILYSRDNLCQQVFPIFYGVDPSHVRHQTGTFAEAFARHQMLQRDDKVMRNWRDSLTKVANLSGWDCKDRPEAEVIDTVVKELWTKLRSRLPPYGDELIGIDSKVQKMEPLLKIGLNDVRFVGIWGLPGVGKTTIARAVLEKYRGQFEISCFLHNVRETSERDGEVHLQSKLLSHLKIRNMEIEDTYEGKKIIQNLCCNKKVLLILDDVSHTTHLENLANSPNWFGAGSRVIITTKNRHLLRRAHAVHEHEVKTMNPHESLELFCKKAFGRREPQENLLQLSKSVCDYAGGLPLALSVLGSFFCGRRSVPEWEDALDMLKKDPHKDIFMPLEMSFNALTSIEKTILLDIACFFNGWSKKVITQILESCGFNAKIGITTLHEKSMLNDYDNHLVIHDLLEQMGKKIIIDKSSNEIGSRSRLWSKEDIDEVMENNLGTKEIQAMVSSTSCEACWDSEAFSALGNLRLLMVSNTLPFGTHLAKLVDLRMRDSKLKKFWNKSLCSKNLKFLDLSYSKNLIESPDFSELPNLERLELEGCEDLVDLHTSIAQLKKLQALNLKGCKTLRACCPKKLEMTALKEFVLSGCLQVKFLPEFGESMKNLETLDAGETNLVKLPESLGLLIGLKTLKLRGCKNLVCLPQSIHNLKRLVVIDISGCSKFARLPERLNEIEGLEELDASETDITEIPPSIGGLEKLKKLSFRWCKRSMSYSWSMILPWRHSVHNGLTLPSSILSIKSLIELDLSYCRIDDASVPDDWRGLSSLERLDLSGNNFKSLPAGCISNLLKLKRLDLNSCSELQSLPQPPPSLCFLEAEECASLETVGGEQLSHLFASMDQWEVKTTPWMDETLSVTIPGREIPSWFENQIDLCPDEDGRALLIVDIPSWEEMLGIGLCILLESKFYNSTEPDTRESAFLWWIVDFGKNPENRKKIRAFDCDGEKKRKSCHRWLAFWKYTKEFCAMVYSRKHSQIPFYLNAGRNNAKVSMKCGWRVIRKSDFENSGSSIMSRSRLPKWDHLYQDLRMPGPPCMHTAFYRSTAFTRYGSIMLPGQGSGSRLEKLQKRPIQQNDDEGLDEIERYVLLRFPYSIRGCTCSDSPNSHLCFVCPFLSILHLRLSSSPYPPSPSSSTTVSVLSIPPSISSRPSVAIPSSLAESHDREPCEPR
ncbi:TMV resistance protein N-like [Neltuma alba]|uniref:TMV resistance protein N-like n=1 Tax=Neltuma alba TaxID=207710 RepID=UPI0010A47C66|nr:TMV resistance protein N-like [Prosopis alba]